MQAPQFAVYVYEVKNEPGFLGTPQEVRGSHPLANGDREAEGSDRNMTT